MNKFKFIIIGIIFSSFILCNNDMFLSTYEEKSIDERILCSALYEFIVTVTMYNPTYEQTDSTPNITADNTIIELEKASEYRYVALSRDLLSRWGGPFDYDDVVCIDNIGEYSGLYKVKDTMNAMYKHRVDILKTEGQPNFKFEKARLSLWEGN